MRILRVVKCLRHLLLAQRHSRENENDCDKKGDSLLPSDSQHEKKKKHFLKGGGGEGVRVTDERNQKTQVFSYGCTFHHPEMIPLHSRAIEMWADDVILYTCIRQSSEWITFDG